TLRQGGGTDDGKTGRRGGYLAAIFAGYPPAGRKDRAGLSSGCPGSWGNRARLSPGWTDGGEKGRRHRVHSVPCAGPEYSSFCPGTGKNLYRRKKWRWKDHPAETHC